MPSECFIILVVKKPTDLISLSSAWDEIHDVFGDGHEYDWALEADDEVPIDEDHLKPDMKYQDVRLDFFLSFSVFRPLLYASYLTLGKF